MQLEFLAGSYKRYKEDTNVFTTWLSKAAIACGWKAPESTRPTGPSTSSAQENPPKLPSARLKGKARKEAKKATEEPKPTSKKQETPRVPIVKYTVTTKDIIDQAEAVATATKARIQMPSGIRHVVERAIDARQRCAAWFQETGVQNEYSTEGHVYFIEVLQKALGILKPCYADASGTSPSSGQASRKAPGAEPTNALISDLGNRFRMLDVDDADDILDVAASDISVAKAPSSKKGTTSDVWILEEIEAEMDLAFAVFCFFEDLHRIQEFLKETWKSYKDGKVDLVTASVTTNAAFDIVRRTEEEIIAANSGHPGHFSKPKSYESLAMVLFYEDSFSKGLDPRERMVSNESLRITPFDDFIYLSTARTLMKFERMSELKVPYPQPVPPVRFSYISRPELLELPNVKQWERDDELLCQLLMDLSLLDITKDMDKNREVMGKPTAEDELSKGLFQLRKNGEISVWIVFASRVLMDVWATLGEQTQQCYQEVREAGAAASKLLDFKVEGGALVPTGERWVAKDSTFMLDLWTMITNRIDRDPLTMLKEMMLKDHKAGGSGGNEELEPAHQEHVRRHLREKYPELADGPSEEHKQNAKRLDIRMYEPAKDLAFIWSQNPILCGTMAFHLTIDMEQAGISLANHQQSIFPVAHLYNALQQMNLIQGLKWPEMDKLIEMHMGVLFAGKFPTTPKEFHSRFAIRCGLSVTNYARNRRAGALPLVAAGKRDGPQIPPTKTSAIFRQLLDNKESMDRSLYRLENLIQDSEASESSRKATYSSRRQLTPLQFLSHIQDWMSKVIEEMKVDYISLVRTCNKLLRRVRRKIEDDLDIQYPKQRGEDSNEPGNIVMVLCLLQEASEAQYIKDEVLRGRVDLPGAPQLTVAGEAMKAFWNKQRSITSG